MANLPYWAPTFNNSIEVSNLVEKMRLAKWINEKTFGDISSFSFHRKVFYNNWWDKNNIKARGLFINTKTNEIVARSYDKFFNINEKKETQMGTLKKKLCWPIRSYVKENGFLGILGYDKVTDSLFTASKSTPEGPYADNFRDILLSNIDNNAVEMLKEYLYKGFCSFIFEVNDSINDPHMIEHDNRHVVLLDVIKRSAIFERVPYNHLIEIASMFGFKVKQPGPEFADWDIFNLWYSNATRSFNYLQDGKNIEGFVIEDSLGFQTKVKLRYYSFWKYMRSCKDKILRHRIKKKPFPQQLLKMSTPLEQQFIDWVKVQPDEILEKDIISIRKLFNA